MNTSDAFGVFLPDEGLDELFDMVKFEKTDNAAWKRQLPHSHKDFQKNSPTILNYFIRHAKNASAEAFNSKVKIFRSLMRGVRDRDFFIFRLVKLYA